MSGIEALSLQECLHLLGTRSVGRVAYTERALPSIRPVNYALVGRHIVLRTRVDGLAARLDGQVVAFEVDDVDPELRTGWSVVATGSARVLRDPDELDRANEVPLAAWAGAEHATVVWITVGDLQGRRVGGAVSTGAA